MNIIELRKKESKRRRKESIRKGIGIGKNESAALRLA